MKKKSQSQSKAVVPNPNARLLSVQEAAGFLGVTVWFIRGLVWNKKVPHLRLGRRFLFDRKDLENFIEQQKKEAA